MRDDGLYRLDGQVVVVVGAASGIGEAVALAAGRQGAEVVVVDVNEVGALATAEQVKAAGARAEAMTCDVSKGPEVAAVFGALEGRPVRGVVCTPGVNVRKPLLAYTEDEFDRVVRVNLKGNFNVLQAAGRLLTSRKGGSIVLFSSIRSQVVEPGQGVYAATKAGVLQMAKAAAAEFGPSGVRVNAVAPGVTETPLTAPIKANQGWYDAYASKTALGRWASAAEMAGPTVFLLSDAASYITGTLLVVDGGWLAIDGRFTPPGM